MKDYDVLKFLGLEIKDKTVIFYDDESDEHIIEFSEIKEISLDLAGVSVDKKFKFWFEKLFVVKSFGGILDTKTNSDDYRKNYE